jgi:hypothetical protein
MALKCILSSTTQTTDSITKTVVWIVYVTVIDDALPAGNQQVDTFEVPFDPAAPAKLKPAAQAKFDHIKTKYTAITTAKTTIQNVLNTIT